MDVNELNPPFDYYYNFKDLKIHTLYILMNISELESLDRLFY